MKVSLATDPKDITSVVSITAENTEVCGRVSAVDAAAGTITLTDRAGTATTYTLGAAATVKVNGAAGTLGDIAAGFRVELKLSALDGTTVIAVEAVAGRPGHGKMQPGGGNQGGNAGQMGMGMGLGIMAKGPGPGHRR